MSKQATNPLPIDINVHYGKMFLCRQCGTPAVLFQKDDETLLAGFHPTVNCAYCNVPAQELPGDVTMQQIKGHVPTLDYSDPFSELKQPPEDEPTPGLDLGEVY
jgi:hypothetical protein